jgi:hypothetical protein
MSMNWEDQGLLLLPVELISQATQLPGSKQGYRTHTASILKEHRNWEPEDLAFT